MKWSRLFLLLLFPVLLAGCSTLTHNERQVLRTHDVPPDVYDRMMDGDPLSPDDVIALSQRAVPPGLIIRYMQDTDTVYRLPKPLVKKLRAAGVSEEVISYMLSTAPPYGPYGPGPRGVDPYAYPPYAGPYPYDPYYYYGYPYAGGPVFFVGGWGWGRGWGGGWGHGGWHGGWGHDHR